MLNAEPLKLIQEEYDKKYPEPKYDARFTRFDVNLDGFFGITDLEYIIELMKKYGCKV